MKALSIGRDQNCDIVINDNTDVISRRHAILNISSSGKITLVDQSRNGTYVNGIRITPNVPVPVSRKDIISFAHVAKLDWNAVPASNTGMRFAAMGAIAVLIIICGILGYKYLPLSDNDAPNIPVTVTDTIRPAKTEPQETTNIKQDKEVKQSKDTIPVTQKKENKSPKRQDKGKKKEEILHTPEDSVKDNRPIG